MVDFSIERWANTTGQYETTDTDSVHSHSRYLSAPVCSCTQDRYIYEGESNENLKYCNITVC